jgi:succinate dehydrogenase flavin-adding protein (antitoxin of CptAB toxin-antitoxin module)
MRELDELLLRYLDDKYATADDAEKAAFQRLLSLSDAALMSYLLQQATPSPEVALAVNALLDRDLP